MHSSGQVERVANVQSRTRRISDSIQLTLWAFAIAIAIAITVLATSPALAQVEGATLRGEVASPAGPQAGVPVVAEHIAMGQVRRTTSGTDGTYVMVGLRPGTYHVQVGAAAEPEEVTLRVGQTATRTR